MKWQLNEFKDKDVVFVGAGQGRAMAGVQDFLEKFAQIRSFQGVNKQEGDKPLDFLDGYDENQTIFIKNEAIPGPEMPVAYITPMQIFFSQVKLTGATTVGITGTKGKSTTTALTAHILKSAGKSVVLGGNIGVSPLLGLENANSDTIFVLELSSYQLSDLKVSPTISACLNLFNDHTNWHGSLETYWEAKHNIMRFTGPDDVFIYNPDFETLENWAKEADCRTIAINKNDNLSLAGAKLFGEHNRLNALVAREIARQFGVVDDTTQRAIDDFEPLAHRMQLVTTKNGLTFIDDAIGMTPESTSASLQAVTEKYGPVGCLLLGGQDRNYDFSGVMRQIAKLGVPNLVLFPDTVEKMRQALPDNYNPRIFETSSMSEAVNFAAQSSPSGSVVLLSTAAPSYSLWRDFEQKGDEFQATVSSLS